MIADAPSGGPVVEELDVSIILPVYNEAEHLEPRGRSRVRAAMDASPYSYEIIVVDDGSTDNSAEVASRIEGIRFIHFLQNRGSGSARKAGTQAARGRVTVWTDVDMTYPNDTIPQLVKELDGYDQVVGARTTEEGTVKALRVPAKWLIRKLASFLTAHQDPRPQLGLPRVPHRRRPPVPQPAPRRLLVRHHDHHDVPRGRLLGEVRADRVREARRRVEVPLVQGHAALRDAGRAHDPLVQPAADLHAGRARRCSRSAS